jgi:large subunit ribosomal protein L15
MSENNERALKVHHLRPAPGAKTAKTRVGRGEASKGKTAGRGTKGTKARYQVKAGFAGGQLPLQMRLPKLRGFTNPFRVEYQVVNLDKISELFPEGGDVTVEALVAKGAVRKNQPVKVLGQGELSVKVDVKVNAFSKSPRSRAATANIVSYSLSSPHKEIPPCLRADALIKVRIAVMRTATSCVASFSSCLRRSWPP